MIEQQLKDLILSKYKSILEFAKVIDMPYSTIDNIFKRGIRNANVTNIIRICKELGISADSLAVGEITFNSKKIYDIIFPITIQRLPMLGEIACGEPIFADEDRESYIEVGTNINADFCLRAKGDSMINARIHDGDIVFIKKQSMVENGDVAAIIIDDSATLKRFYYYRESNKIILNAENTKYAPLIYNGDELQGIHILGKAVAFQSDIL